MDAEIEIELMEEIGEIWDRGGNRRESREQELDVEAREFKQEVERRRVMGVKEMQLQSEEMMSVVGLEERWS